MVMLMRPKGTEAADMAASSASATEMAPASAAASGAPAAAATVAATGTMAAASASASSTTAAAETAAPKDQPRRRDRGRHDEDARKPWRPPRRSDHGCGPEGVACRCDGRDSANGRAPAAQGGSEQPFNMGEAKAKLGGAASAAQGCKKGDGPTGSGRVVVMFAPSGAAQSATVTGPPFEGTPTGACVSARFRGVRVPAFSGSPFSVSKSFSIN